MLNRIRTQIDNINKSIEWIRTNRKEEFYQRYITLIEERRKLLVLEKAESSNPGIAAFGQSQVGKSYLMNCILKDRDGKFMVEADGKKYSFVEEINPIGNGDESTGVVTRFSSYLRNPAEYDKRYPIRMRVLKISDIICILCEAYLFEFDDSTTISEQEIKKRCKEMKAKYIDKNPVSHPAITADHILNMRDYLNKYISKAVVFTKHTTFFETIALIIDKVPIEDYVEVFSVLWSDIEEYTNLFKRMLDVLKRLEYRDYVYLPIQATLHGGIKEDTIMSVSCLMLLNKDKERDYTTNAYLKEDGNFRDLGEFTKSELCAICSEVVVKIGEEYITTNVSFDESMMSERSVAELNKKLYEAEKCQVAKKKADGKTYELDLLKYADLLDFPGARSRGGLKLEKLKEKDTFMYCILRGKVAYLFNINNEEMIINILLFCHHHKLVEPRQMWQLLDEWVKGYVGNTPEERNEYIQKLGGSPFFHVGTMFNLNLDLPHNDAVGKLDTSINNIWKSRFITQLIIGCFMNCDWVFHWDGSSFQNCYMLRDFGFSKNIYKGWKECKMETGFCDSYDEDYYQRNRKQFILCNSEYGESLSKLDLEEKKNYKLFSDPELAWDVSATKNNDGSLYILLQLAKVAARISEARESQIEKRLKACSDRVYGIMHAYYKSTDPGEKLEQNVNKAFYVFRELDFACNDDNYFFGHLLQAIQLNSVSCYRIVHSIVNNPNLIEDTNKFDQYEIIRKSSERAGYPIDEAKNDGEKWDCVIKTYRYASRESAEIDLRKKGVDIAMLFSGSYKRKMCSYVISDAVFDMWTSRITSIDMLNDISKKDSFDASAMTTLVENIISVARRIKLSDIMANEIAEYVNVINVQNANQNLLADILASMINDFIIDFGFSRLTDKEKQHTKNLCINKNIPAFKYIEKQLPSSYEEEYMTALFNEMSSSPFALLPSFEDNYNKWLEYMFISFMSGFDEEELTADQKAANDKLKEILKVIKSK